MRMLTVSKNEAGQRLDKLLAKYLNLAGKSFIYKMMRKKNITLNGKKCDGSEHLTEGDEIKLFLAEETIEKFSEVKIQKVQKKKLDIVYEDEHILLINKPSGMLSQKAKETDESLVEYLIDYLLDSGKLKKEDLPPVRLQPPRPQHKRHRGSWTFPAGTADHVRSHQGSESGKILCLRRAGNRKRRSPDRGMADEK